MKAAKENAAKEDKRDKIDAIVRELAKTSEEVAKTQIENKPVADLYREMERQIARIRALQGYKKPNVEIQDSKRDMKPLIAWLKEKGLSNVADFEITFNQLEGHCLTTKKDIKKDEIIMEVPFDLMMTNKTAVESTRVALLLHNDPMLQDLYTLVLALHLMTEKYSPNSFWAPYINSLPRVTHSPLYWSYEETMQLEGTLFFAELVKYKAAIARQYTHVYFRLEKQLEVAVMKRSSFTWEAFLWAYSTVNARKNPIAVAGKNGPVHALALIPFFDLINHEPAGEVTTYCDVENRILKHEAHRTFKKDEQIKMFYGVRANFEFLMNQGFLPAKNPYNYVVLSFKLSENDALYTEKSEVLRQLKMDAKEPRFRVSATSFEPDLLTFFRITWANKEELNVFNEKMFGEGKEKEEKEKAFMEPISLQNEQRVFTMLNLKLNQLLKQYKRTLEEDQKLLNESHNPRDQNAFKVIVDERQILISAQKNAAAKITECNEKIAKATNGK